MASSQHCQPVPPPVDKLPIEKTGEAPVWCPRLERRFKMLVVQQTTNMNILVDCYNLKLSAQKWEQKLKYNFDHDHNLLPMFDSQKNDGQNLVEHSHKYDKLD